MSVNCSPKNQVSRRPMVLATWETHKEAVRTAGPGGTTSQGLQTASAPQQQLSGLAGPLSQSWCAARFKVWLIVSDTVLWWCHLTERMNVWHLQDVIPSITSEEAGGKTVGSSSGNVTQVTSFDCSYSNKGATTGHVMVLFLVMKCFLLQLMTSPPPASLTHCSQELCW